MRLVQVTVPTGKREAVLRVLDEEGVDYAVSGETSDRDVTDVVHFPLPTEAVEPILDRLREVGVGDESYTVIVAAETVVSEHFEGLTERYAGKTDEDRIAREELASSARELAPSMWSYAVLTVVSGIIATAGLLLDSPAVVVGSMVIAPLIGPAMASAVGTVLDDPELWTRGVKLQVLGMFLAVGSAALFASVSKSLALVPPGIEVATQPEIRERLAPDFLSLAVALGAGVAGATSLTTGVSAALVGVMIAVALVPPAATVGIGIAWGLPAVALGAGVLALVNWLSINLAATSVLWYRGYSPRNWFRLDQARSKVLKRMGVLVLAIALLSVFLGGVTFTSAQQGAFEQDVRDATTDVIEPYNQVHLIDLTVEYGEGVLFQDPTRVVVTIGHEGGVEEISPPIGPAIRDQLDRDLPVEVRFVETQTSGVATSEA